MSLGILLLLPLFLLPGPPAGIIAIAEINEAMDSGDYQQTLAALLLPTAKLSGVDPAPAKHYHDLLQDTKRLLCQVPKIAPEFRLSVFWSYQAISERN